MEDRERHRMSGRGGRYLRLARDPAAEVADELDAHIDLLAADLVAEGWDPHAAVSEARRRFEGRAELERFLTLERKGLEREARVRQWISEFAQDLRLAVRQYRHKPLIAVLTAAVFAVGVGAAVAVFAVLDATLLRPLPFVEPERIVYVADRQGEEDGYPASLPELRDWEEHADFLAHVAGWYTSGRRFITDADPLFVYSANVVGDLPSVLGVQPLVGTWFAPQAGELQVVLDEAFWSGRFGRDPGVVGRTIVLGDQSYEVVGVLPTTARIALRRTDVSVYVPFAEQPWMDRGTHFLNVIARVKPEVAMPEAEARLAGLAESFRSDGRTIHGVGMAPVRDVLLSGTNRAVLLLAGAVVFLLLIVIANLANLWLARSLEREKEWTIRTALGARRSRLLRQLLVESWAVAAIGLAGALLVARSVMVWVAPAAGARVLADTARLDARVLVVAAVFTFFVASLIALLANMRVSRVAAASALAVASRSTGSRAHWRGRRALIGFEMAVSVVLLVGAALMVRSVSLLLDVDPGFDPANTIVFALAAPASAADEPSRATFFATLLEELRAVPGVEATAAVNEIPLSGGDVSGGFGIPGSEFPEGQGPYAKKRVVTPGYFETMHIPVLAGRTFQPHDRAGGLDVVVVSRSIADRYWPDGNAVGQRIRYSWGPGEEQEIVGIVGDVHHDALDRQPEGMIYRPHGQFVHSAMHVLVRAHDDPMALLPAIRSVTRNLAPSEPLREVGTLESIRRESLGPRRTLEALLGAYSLIALLLTALGVYAVSAQAVAQRTQELGIRMALGAATPQIASNFFGTELPPIALGLAAGVVGAVAATRYMASMLYGVSPLDPLAFAGAILLLVVVGIFALAAPLRRATSADPNIALKN